MLKYVTLLLIGFGVFLVAGSDSVLAAARHPGEPGWMPVVFARGELREQIEATPIEQRPYRPFHFYGNTVRRMYYRGTRLPRPGEVLATPVRAVIRRPQANLTTTNLPANSR